jgi:hypothetical protein
MWNSMPYAHNVITKWRRSKWFTHRTKYFCLVELMGAPSIKAPTSSACTPINWLWRPIASRQVQSVNLCQGIWIWPVPFIRGFFTNIHYDPTVVRSYTRIIDFSLWVNGNLIDIYYLEKNSRCLLILSKTFLIFHFLYTTIPFYIFDNTFILLIRSLNTTVRQLKKSVI